MNTKHNEKKYTIRRDAKNVYFTDDTETGALPLYGFPEKIRQEQKRKHVGQISAK